MCTEKSNKKSNISDRSASGKYILELDALLIPGAIMDVPTNREESVSTLRRPMNAFLLFCKRHRSVVRSGHPWLDNRSCTKLLAEMWAVLNWEEKSQYLQLARECKLAFMKAHPNYKWCGSSKQHTKDGTPRMKTRTKSTSQNVPKYKTLPSSSTCRISPGKLADPCNMGGLSLLLLAGEQTMSKTAPTSQSELTSLPSPKSRLFEFAEMCMNQLEPQCKTEKVDLGMLSSTTKNVDYNGNCTVSHEAKLRHKSALQTEICDRSNYTAENVKRTPNECCYATTDQDNSEKSSQVMNKTPCKMDTEIKNETTSKNLNSRLMNLDCKLKDEDSVLQCRSCKDEEHHEHDLDLSSSTCNDEWIDQQCARRKSSRSCKGRLYREFVMEGMLETLQRPERPFNCKKSWKQMEGTSLSDGDDAAFSAKHGSRTRLRKRTVSGCGSLTDTTDFDCSEIDVEARLASLPQYTPDQFQTKPKCHRAKTKSTSLYKNNASFAKKQGTSRDARFQPRQLPVAGSRKRKAPKSSILHLTRTQNSPSQGTSCKSSQFVVSDHKNTGNEGATSPTISSNHMFQSQKNGASVATRAFTV